MVNFQVQNLEAMAAELRAAGVAAEVDSQEYPNERFARMRDPERKRVELGEPARRDAAG